MKEQVTLEQSKSYAEMKKWGALEQSKSWNEGVSHFGAVQKLYSPTQQDSDAKVTTQPMMSSEIATQEFTKKPY